VSDEFDPLRRLRPDRVLPDDPGDPAVLSREKERLMAMIDQTHADQPATRPTPGIYPRLAYQDEMAALDYLIRVFGFTERREARLGTGAPDDSMLAWLELGDGVVMIGRAEHDLHRIYSPREVGGQATAMVNVAVHDIDAHYAHSVSEGADITMELEDAFYGYRRYEATDLEGHRWHFTESFADIRARGGTVEGDA
jgi:PhnB protein